MRSSTGSRAAPDPVTAYAQAVVAGEIPAGQWHRRACARHLFDLEQSQQATWPYVFDARYVADVERFFRLLRHYKGRWAGQPFTLEPWQQFLVGALLGWKHRESGRRRFRHAFIECCRGQGKSTLAAGIALLLAFVDGEPGAEGYCFATKRDQARIVFGAARRMVMMSSTLRRRIRVFQHSLHDEATASFLHPLGADADTLDGLRPHIAVGDEIHRHASPDLIEVIESGMGTRDQPMLFLITTAGEDEAPHTAYGQQVAISQQVLTGFDHGFALDEWFAFIAAADPEDDPASELTWRKANPSYGITVDPAFLAKEWRQVEANPYERAKFERYYLGRRVSTIPTYYDVEAWDRAPRRDPEALRGAPCVLGLDLSSTVDLTAAAAVWRLGAEHFAVQVRVWVPEEGLADRARRDRVPYPEWVAQGWLETLPGSAIDYARLREVIRDWARQLGIRALGLDPWHAGEIGQAWHTVDRLPVVEVPQRMPILAPQTVRLQRILQSGAMAHDHSPLVRWMLSNVVVREDERGHVMPVKRRSRGRIDGVQAILTALAVLEQAAESVYRGRGAYVLA